MNKSLKVFVSYSHDSDEHKIWVSEFSSELRWYGINIVLDQWNLHYGQDIALFIESNIRDSEKVLIVCTDQYVEKANLGKDGVGYERMIVTRELMQNIDTDKFIPVIRQSSNNNRMPDFMGVRFYADFRDDSRFEVEIKKLASHFGVKVSSGESIEKMSKRNLKKLRQDLLRQGGLFDFNPVYNKRHFNTLNRLIVNANRYFNLNILFDVEIPYTYESSVHSMLSGNMFDIPVGEFCGIYEFIYKFLNSNFTVPDSEYAQGLATIIEEGTSQEIFDYLLKFKKILELFEEIMVNSQGVISQDFPNGEYDHHTLVVVRNKKQQLSAILKKYYNMD